MQVSSYTFQTPYSQQVQVGRPDPSMAKEEKKAQEQSDKSKEDRTELLGDKSKKDQVELSIKSSAIYQNDEGYNDLASSVKAFTEFSKNAQRSQNLNTYVKNGSDFSALTKVNSEPSSQSL
jgi:hypothetical protein